MKKTFLYLFLIVATASCSKKDDNKIFEKSADERLNEALSTYQSQLVGSQYGWNGVLYADSGRGTPYSFYFKFDASNRVKMLSDFDSTSAATLKESSYRLKALQQPSLLFDTYSYIHVLADPDPNVNGGGYGSGLQTDFEFYFDSVGTDVIRLGGRFHGTKLVLTRATQQDATALNNGQLAAAFYINKILTYFKRLTIGNQLIDFQINPYTRKVTFTWLDASGNTSTFTTSYYLTPGGIALTNPLVIGTTVIKTFDNLAWNATTQTINLAVNGTAASIRGVVVPLKVDVGAPARWWQYASDNNGLWVSFNGFHVNGVDDAFGLRNLKDGVNSYYFLVYWPQYAPRQDLFAPIFINPAQDSLILDYATLSRRPNTTSDGRAVFSEITSVGYPTTGPAAQTRTLLNNATGYYFVQTSETTYDMVSATDGKSWITWEFSL
jgi:hypothetical protein